VNKSNAIRRGFVGMAISQGGVIACQFIYSYFTARLFAPTSFGTFTVMLSLQGFLMLVGVAGFSSYILRVEFLDRSDLRRIRIYALKVSLISTSCFVACSPGWIWLLRADWSATAFIPGLAAALLIAPFSTIEAALLRREGRRLQDAATSFIALFLSALAALSVGMLTRSAVSLTIVTLGVPILSGLMSRAFRRETIKDAQQVHDRLPLKYIRNITRQNLVFLLLNQLPIWLISSGLGAREVGFFTRATVLTQLPANNLVDAINRPLQPMWRHLESEKLFVRGALDSVRMAASLSFSIFACIFVVGPELSKLWLGRGWELSSLLVQPLSIFAAFFVPYSVVVGLLEIRGLLALVKKSQIISIVILAIGAIHFYLDPNVVLLAYYVAGAQILALAGILFSFSRGFGMGFNKTSITVLEPLAWGLINSFSLFCSQNVLRAFFPTTEGTIFELVASVVIACVIFVATFRFQTAANVIRDRKIQIPAILARITKT
jgi:O-antigen/teichoic acid export membrane protein